MKSYLFGLALLFISNIAQATHEAGGQISTRYISASQQEVKITLWVDSTGMIPNNINYLVQANNTSNSFTASLSNSASIGNALLENTYLDTLSLTTTGNYKLVYSTCCRSAQISNINSPAQQNFYIATNFLFDPSLMNSTPEFLNAPDFYAGLLDTFLHNPLAADIDNDAMLFYADAVYGNNGQVIPFTMNPYPSVLGWSFTVDSLNGQIEWIPNVTGKYAYTVRVDEWRNGVIISSSIREALINACNGCKTTMSSEFVFQTDGWPNNGQYTYLNTYANTPYSITFNGGVGANNSNTLLMRMPTQAHVHQNKPTFVSVQVGQTVSGTFQWTPHVSQVSNDPYLGVLVGQETGAGNQRRQKEKTIYIKVNPAQTTGLNPTSIDPIKVYPNPAQHEVRIDFKQLKESDRTIQIVSMDGRMVYKQTVSTPDGVLFLNTENWPNGLYMVRFENSMKLNPIPLLIRH